MKAREARGDILGVITPKREDVLSGRGPSCARHNATTLWWSLVQRHAAKYRTSTNRQTKGLIVTMVCDKVHKAGGRFLEKRDDSSTHESLWDEIKVRAAHIKTSQALRDVRSDIQPLPPDHGTLEKTSTSVADTLADPPTKDIYANDTNIAVGALKDDSAYGQDVSIQASNTVDDPWEGTFCRNTIRSGSCVTLQNRPR
jgi:hypothetical protein